MDWKTLVVIDLDEARRIAVYRSMARLGQTIPVGQVGELGRYWPESAWFLVHDDGAALDALQREFARRGTFHPIIMYGDAPTPERIVAAIHDGAMNYVAWPSEAAAVRKSLDDVADLARKRCEHSTARLAARNKVGQLTARELEVLQAMRSGMTSKEIGRALGISHRTVEVHRANAMTRLGALNSAGMVTLLVAAGDEDEAEAQAAA